MEGEIKRLKRELQCEGAITKILQRHSTSAQWKYGSVGFCRT